MDNTYSTRVRAPNIVGGLDCGNDSTGVKPSGPLGDDEHDRPKTHIKKNQENSTISTLSCRRTTKIGTLNVRTIRAPYKRLELANIFESSGIDILGIQEHRIIHNEPILITKLLKDSYMLTTSSWRNGAGAATGGVGLLLTNKTYKAITDIQTISPRILLVSFDGNPKLSIIVVYSPTESDTTEVAEEFHTNLRSAVSQLPAHNMLLVIGDFNAHLSKNHVSDPLWYFHQTTNRNGELLRDTLEEAQLEATNHRFQKRPGKMWTYLSDATLTKTQLDYVLVRKKWKNCVKNTEPYNFFSSLGSDHRVVVSDVKLSLRKSKRLPKRVVYDWDAFKCNDELQSEYTVNVRNRYSLLSMEDDSSDITTQYERLTTAIAEANEKLLPRRKKQSTDDPSTDHRVVDARKELMKSKTLYHTQPSEDHRYSVKLQKDILENAYKVVEEENLTNKIRKVEQAADRCKNKESWDLINNITGRKKSSCGLIKGGSAKDRMAKWKDHFENLLGQPPIGAPDDLVVHQRFSDLNISTDPFTIEELKSARKKIVEGKACGPDGVTPEVMKRCDLDDIILKFYNGALESGEIPDQWRLINLVPVPKKGDLTCTDSYRGIGLASLVSKTLNRMILHRIQHVIDPLLRNNQNGFRNGRSTTSHILTLRRVLEGARMKNLPAAMLFIDFKKAFDSIHRGTLMKILLAYGIPKKIVDLIELLHSNTKAQVLTVDGLTEIFDILAGVMQGDTLAPFLFVIVIDYCMTQALSKHPDAGFTIRPAQSRRVKAIKITDADFADDIALLANSIQEVQDLLHDVEIEASLVGLKMNEGKTKYLVENIDNDQQILSTSGQAIDRVEDFIYLGSWIRSTEKDIKVRKAKAWAACHKLKKVWKSDLRKALKIRLFTATVESVLLYGSETWTLNTRLSRILDGCYTRMLRMAMDVSWKQHLTNFELYGSLPKLTSKIAQRRLKLAGHSIRHPELTSNAVTLWEPLHGKTNRGRPKLTYIDCLRKDIGIENTSEINTMMLDRVLWRSIVDNAREHHSK